MLNATDHFEQVKHALAGDVAARAQALEAAEARGLPSRRLEHWHYTDLAQLLKKPISANASLIDSDFSALNAAHVAFEDGTIELPDAIDGLTVAAALFDETSDIDVADAMALYNRALVQNGLDLSLDANVAHRVIIETRGDATQHLRHHIKLAPAAQLTLIDDNRATGYTNIFWDIELAENAQLTFIQLQQAGQQVSDSELRLSANAKLTRVHVLSGPDMARHAGAIRMQGAGAHAELHSAVLGGDASHSDITYLIDHQVADTSSNTSSYQALSGHARGVFQGKIIIQRNAQNVGAEMQARAIMLSEHAEMDAKPELEIYADDVACAHGTAIGEIDADALFFLRARGLDEATARQFLIAGFVKQAVAGVEDAPLQQALNSHIDNKIAASLLSESVKS